jgi:hypothetical protein
VPAFSLPSCILRPASATFGTIARVPKKREGTMPRVRSAASSRRLQPILFLAALFAVIGAIVYASTPERASTWRDRDIRVDGSDEEWRGEELPVKGEHFSLGIVNDGEWLYLCIPTKDVGTRTSIARMGLVVWLDREGGKKRRFGIHFPVANPPRAVGLPRAPLRNPGEGQEMPPPDRETEQVPGQNEIGILGPGKNDAQLVPIDQAGGIEARVGLHEDLMVYELKVPLMRTAEHPYAPNVEPGGTVRLEIETAPFRAGMMPIGPGSIGGVIVPGRPWGGGWGVSIGGPSRGGAIIEPIDVTMNVHLAKGPR